MPKLLIFAEKMVQARKLAANESLVGYFVDRLGTHGTAKADYFRKFCAKAHISHERFIRTVLVGSQMQSAQELADFLLIDDPITQEVANAEKI